MNIGNKIVELRAEHKMSQSQLGDLLDVSRQTVSKWECNICDPEIGRIKQIAAIFNVTTDYLLDNEINNNVKPYKKENIFIRIKNKIVSLSLATKIFIILLIVTISISIYTILYANVFDPYEYNMNGCYYYGLSAYLHSYIDGIKCETTVLDLFIISTCLILTTIIYSLFLIIRKNRGKQK